MSAVSRPHAAIFDIEGTLMDCVPLILESWCETLHQAGHVMTHRDLQPYSGMDGAWMLEQLLPHEPEAAREKLLKDHGDHYRAKFIGRAQAFPAVRTLIENLKGQGVGIGIATTCKTDELAIYDRQMRILDLVDAVTCGEMVKHGKPDPSLLEQCRQRLKMLDPGLAIVIGDTPYDALAAQAAHMRAVGVLTGGFTQTSLLDAGCEETYDQVQQIRRIWQSDGAYTATA